CEGLAFPLFLALRSRVRPLEIFWRVAVEWGMIDSCSLLLLRGLVCLDSLSLSASFPRKNLAHITFTSSANSLRIRSVNV
ncbi:unnamed protein product, partial [Urochloa humidicola]